jgi:hypothetical protein
MRSHLALAQTCRQLEIEEIIDIGPPLSFEIPSVNGTPVVSLGIKTPQEISHLLSTSIAGFFNYSLEFLAKSTIFAAYCAHKVIPVGIFYKGQNTDGLESGKHYLLADQHQGSLNFSRGQIVANNAYAWYQNHQLSVQSSTLATYLMWGNESKSIQLGQSWTNDNLP